jgi:hypothetical protein
VDTRKGQHSLDMVMIFVKATGTIQFVGFFVCAGSREGFDHFGSYVGSLSLHVCNRLFPTLEPMTSWSQGNSFTAVPGFPFPVLQVQGAVILALFGRIDKAMAGLRTKLVTAYKTSGGKKVNIISHSMGGLLVRCFMSMNHDVCFCFRFRFVVLFVPIENIS